MKKLTTILLSTLLFMSCNEPKLVGDSDQAFLHSYIPVYVSAHGVAYVKNSIKGEANRAMIVIDLQSSEKGENYYLYAPEISWTTGQYCDEFVLIAERNGDRAYNREDGAVLWLDRLCSADNFSSIDVVCVNADWDSAHPKGSSLNNLCDVDYTSYADFVKSDYKVYFDYTSSKRVVKRLSNLSESELMIIMPSVHIYFDNHPATGKYDMQITLTTTEGEERKLTCTFDFDKEPA